MSTGTKVFVNEVGYGVVCAITASHKGLDSIGRMILVSLDSLAGQVRWFQETEVKMSNCLIKTCTFSV